MFQRFSSKFFLLIIVIIIKVFFRIDQLKDHLQLVREVVEDRSKVISYTLDSMKELDQIIVIFWLLFIFLK